MAQGPFTKLPKPPRPSVIIEEMKRGDLRETSAWFDRIFMILSGLPGIAWSVVSKAGSNLTDIETRNHNNLQTIGEADLTSTDGTKRQHISNAQGKAWEDHRNASQDVHGIGVDNSVVGTGTEQTISNKKYGGDTDYSEFEDDGTLKFNGDATVWNDINKSLLPLTTGVSTPDIIAVNSDAMLKVRSFDGNVTTEELGESFEIVHASKEGTNIVPRIHWCPTTADAGNVKWQLRYMWVDRNGVFENAVTIFVTAAAGGVAWKEHRTSFPEISGTGKHIGSRFTFVLFRDPTDAAAFDFGVHYEIDTIGSRGVTAK